jgi:hypothetical protein
MCNILAAGDQGSVAWSIIVGNPISPDFVDIKVTGQLAGQERTALLSKQPVGGPYQPVTLPDFNCSIAHVNLVPASGTTSTVGTLPLTAFAIDSTAHIMLSSRFQWSWNSDNIPVATVMPVSVAVPAGSPFFPPAPAVANVIGVSSGNANISVLEATSGKSSTAPINVVSYCAATGTWHGSFSGSNGSSGEVSAFFAQSAASITGTVLIDDKKGIQTVAAESPQPGKYMLADNGVHVARIEILEAIPAEVLVGALSAVLSLGKEALLRRLLFPVGLQFLGDLQFVQALEEEQVGDLLNDFERIGNPARPESVPDAVDLIANFTSEHECEALTFLGN